MRMNRKAVASFELVLLIASLFAFSYLLYLSTPVLAAEEDTATLSNPSACCEKTINGAYCINEDEGQCNPNYRSTTTSCETTSYCKLGTCYDSDEGVCLENTPQIVCDDNGGTWDPRPVDEVPQCQLGCCIIADQAAFVPLVRCKKLSTLFGVENNYRTDITSEVQCIAIANAQDKGACVYEKDFERVCEFTTRADCGAGNSVETVDGDEIELSSDRKFYKDYLCSAEELNTACARQTDTKCSEGKVYWTDSCGNLENVYSSNKERSWNNGRVMEANEVCNPNEGSNKNCGNCEYLLGSRCAEYDGLVGGPSDGDYYCQRNECTDRYGNKRINGESWCVYDGTTGEGKDAVGSRHYREYCIDGEVKVEPCADFRNEVCVEDSLDTSEGRFGTAGCIVNKWQDCTSIKEQDDCENTDKRDCIWLPAIPGMNIAGSNSQDSSTGFSNPSTGNAFNNPTGNVVMTGRFLGGGDDEEEEETKTNRPKGICAPNYAPGFNFWSDTETSSICSQASAKCVVVYEESLLGGGRKCVDGCECLEEEWALEANRVCTALGDCGAYVNYDGAFTDDGYQWKEDGKKKKFSPNSRNKIASGFSSMVIAVLSGRSIATSVRPEIVGFNGASAGMVIEQTANPANVPNPYGTYGGASSDLGLFGGDLAVKGAGKTGAGVGANAAGAVKAPPITNTPPTTNPIGIWQGGVQGTPQILGEQIVLDVGGNPLTFAQGSSYQTFANGNIQVGNQLFVKDVATGGYTLNGQAVGADAMSAIQSTATAPAGPAFTNQATLAKWFGLEAGTGASAVVSAVQWAAIAYFAGIMLGDLFGMSEDNSQALGASMAAGFGTYELLSTYNFAAEGALLQNTWIATANPALIGIGIGVVVFLVMYKDVETEIVTFDCLAWQAPEGVDEATCEQCNDDNLPCSEYRCRALGASCELVNEGTEEEKCVNVNPRDVDPPVISPNERDLTKGYEYTDVKSSPPGPGFKIVGTGDDRCIPAFSPLEFGIKVDEPAQCKIDFNHTTSFEDMRNFMGGSNLYRYNHTEFFKLPNAKDLANASFVLENGNEFTFYIRCQDKKGNVNDAEYAVRFCVDDGPDSTAPVIEATSVFNGGCVAEESDSVIVDFYTNEPATCRWSPVDQSYENMPVTNQMSCNNQLYQINAMQLYTCRANLTGVSRDLTNYYVRCKDQPGEIDADRNENRQSFEFNLRGSTALKLNKLKPNETIFGGVSPAPVELYVESLFGCNEGRSICYYSETGNQDDYIMFYDTNNEDGISTQRVDLLAGDHKFYIKCIDEGGNLAEDTIEFDLEIDTNAPDIARVYEEDEMLKIITVRDSECAYSLKNCDFTFEEGTEMPYANSTTHVAEWKNDETFYIKCRDEFKNEDADCSLIVTPSKNFL